MWSHGALEAQIAPGLNPASQSAFAILQRLYAAPKLPAKTSGIKARNGLIVERRAAGEVLMEIARTFGISYQRVHQIVCSSKKPIEYHRWIVMRGVSRGLEFTIRLGN